MDSVKESQQVASDSSSNPVASESQPLKSVFFSPLLLQQPYLSIISCKNELVTCRHIFFFTRKVRSSFFTFAFDFFNQLERYQT